MVCTPIKPKEVRTIWISDVHLGSRMSEPEQLRSFLEHYSAKRIYIVGDLIDGLRLRKKWFWSKENEEIIHRFLDLAKNQTEIYYIPGNHDEFMRAYTGNTIAHIQVVRNMVHHTVDGKRILVLHGDEFDGVMSIAPWLALLGEGAYHFSTWLNRQLNTLRKKWGLRYWSLSAYLNNHSRHASKYIAAFEKEAVEEARKHHADGVICGHIHHPAAKTIEGINYYNCGDWCGHFTALVETRAGVIELVDWVGVVPTQVKERPEKWVSRYEQTVTSSSS